MNKYFVIWTYVANYGNLEVFADSAEEASKIVLSSFSTDFSERGTVYVFSEPEYIYNGREETKKRKQQKIQQDIDNRLSR